MQISCQIKQIFSKILGSFPNANTWSSLDPEVPGIPVWIVIDKHSIGIPSSSCEWLMEVIFQSWQKIQKKAIEFPDNINISHEDACMNVCNRLQTANCTPQ